jgi:hypothetical protein
MSTVANKENALEKAICQKAEAQFQIAIREWGKSPESQERIKKREENINRIAGRGTVFSSSINSEIQYNLLPLINQLIKIELDLRVDNHISFTEERIITLKEYFRNYVKERWYYIVLAAYEESVSNVIHHDQYNNIAEYQEKELAERRDRILLVEPEGLFELIDMNLQEALADSVIHSEKQKSNPLKDNDMETPEEKRKKMLLKIVGGLVVLVLVLIGFSILPPLGSVLWLLFLIIAYPLIIAFTTSEQSMDNANLVELYKKGLSEVPVLGKIFGKFFDSKQG